MRRARSSPLPLLALALGGCRNDMHNQAKTKPLRESHVLRGRQPRPGRCRRASSRAASSARTRRSTAASAEDGKFVLEHPRARHEARSSSADSERFDIFCSPCHGRTGEGQGMIVARGFKNPSTFHVDRLRNERAGYFFDVMTNGFGQMSSYAAPDHAGGPLGGRGVGQNPPGLPEHARRISWKGRRETLESGGDGRRGRRDAAAGPDEPAPSPHSPSRKSESGASR